MEIRKLCQQKKRLPQPFETASFLISKTILHRRCKGVLLIRKALSEAKMAFNR
jgi:hypothetical protein